jgi:hypothetical protein
MKCARIVDDACELVGAVTDVIEAVLEMLAAAANLLLTLLSLDASLEGDA